jgi:beta-glucanase (GH16 family)
VAGAVLTLAAALTVTTTAPVATAVEQTATIAVLPPISQAGATAASPAGASTVVAVEVTPALPGRTVVLSRLAGKSWRTVAATALTDRGLAEFSVPTYDAGRPLTYRATASAVKGLKAVTTAQVVSTTWGAPDFVDEFSGTALGPSWSHRGGAYNPDGLRRCSKGSPDAVRVGDGAVRLSVVADPARLTEACAAYRKDGSLIGQFTYRLNGHISTQDVVDLTYGVAAARMKFPQGRGQHGAFWLQPTAPVPGATSAATGGAEIDVIEWFGDGGANGGLSGSVYHPTPSGQAKEGGWITAPEQYLAGTSDSWWSGYHVFSVEWTPEAYVFRVDGRETWRTSAGVSGVPEYPILSLLSSDYELPNLGGEDRLPQHLDVDWVQFWRS